MKFSLASLQEKHKIGLFAASLVVIAWLFYSYVLLPQNLRIAELKVQCQAGGQQVQLIEAYAAAHPDIEHYLNELDGKIGQVSKILPDNNNIRDFLVQAEQAAKESSVRLSQIKPGQAVNKNGYREIPVEIAVKGSYFQILEFANKLENGPRFNTITNISMRAQQGILDNTVSVIIYSYGTAPIAEQTAAGGKQPPVDAGGQSQNINK